MFTIGMNFHVIHMTDDLDELDAWYDDVFSVVRWMNHQHSEILARDASLVLISDLCIEPMAPAFQLQNWDSVALGRFFKRFGKRWHSIAWYVSEADDIIGLYDHLIANDVRVYSGIGVPSPDSPPRRRRPALRVRRRRRRPPRRMPRTARIASWSAAGSHPGRDRGGLPARDQTRLRR